MDKSHKKPSRLSQMIRQTDDGRPFWVGRMDDISSSEYHHQPAAFERFSEPSSLKAFFALKLSVAFRVYRSENGGFRRRHGTNSNRTLFTGLERCILACVLNPRYDTKSEWFEKKRL